MAKLEAKRCIDTLRQDKRVNGEGGGGSRAINLLVKIFALFYVDYYLYRAFLINVQRV